jgi:TctA family transporter
MIPAPMLEKSVLLSLISSGGSLAISVEQPITAFLLVVASFLVLSPVLKWMRRKKEAAGANGL